MKNNSSILMLTVLSMAYSLPNFRRNNKFKSFGRTLSGKENEPFTDSKGTKYIQKPNGQICRVKD
jgi:hypothetical protein